MLSSILGIINNFLIVIIVTLYYNINIIISVIERETFYFFSFSKVFLKTKIYTKNS